jgi:peroxiredoxin Q/BCP
MSSIKVGDPAPPLAAEAHDGRRVSLSEFRGQRAVVLFFYPRDGTSVCTAEACAFRDAHEDFAKAGAVVIGVSGDSLERHRSFASERELPYLLLSDQDGSIRKAFGVPKTFGIFPGRVTYVIDKQGVVRHIFNSQFTGERHTTEALAMVRQLIQEPPTA